MNAGSFYDISPRLRSGFLLFSTVLKPLLRCFQTVEHPYQPTCACAVPVQLEHTSHAVRELTAGGKRLTGACGKQPLPRNCPNVLGGQSDLRDCGPVNQLIKRGIKLWIVLQTALMGCDVRVSHNTRGRTRHKPMLFINYVNQRHPTGSFTIVAYDP